GAEKGWRGDSAEAPAPPGQARWGRRRVGAAIVQKPPLHRGKPGGGGEGLARRECRSARSTGASPVGAEKGWRGDRAEAPAPPGQARWGRRRVGAAIVQKPPLHRGKPGGGGEGLARR